MMQWIDRHEREPDPKEHKTILVYGDITPLDLYDIGVYVCKHGSIYSDTWVDHIEEMEITFQYWMPVPPPPQTE